MKSKAKASRKDKKRRTSGTARASSPLTLATEREREIIEGYRQQREEEKAVTRRLEQSPREYAFWGALRDNPRTALRKREHKATIHNMETWPGILAKVSEMVEGLPQPGIEQIAEVLCAARFFKENTIGIGNEEIRPWFRVELNAEGEAWPPTDAVPGLPFDALSLNRTLGIEKRIHRLFVRKSKRLLKELEEYRAFLRNCPPIMFKRLNYEALAEMINFKLAPAIRSRIKDEPSLHGTRLRKPDERSPRNIAVVEIVSVLRKRGRRTEANALRECSHLLAIVWPDLDKGLEDPEKEDQLLAALRQAYRRGRPARKPRQIRHPVL